MTYSGLFDQKIAEIKSQNRFRQFLDICRICGRFPYAINNQNNQEIVLWCSNDYLGMGQNKLAIDVFCQTAQEMGLSAGGTRNISGNNHPLVLLEKEVANLHQKEAGLVFNSGYLANESTISALAKIIENLVIFSDQKNHASIISGIKKSALKKHIFNHNDLNSLETLLKQYPLNQPKLIVFESVYSMDGDIAKIDEIVKLAKKFNALTYVDEVHGVGLYGKNGGGICEKLNVSNKVDIIQGTFAKAFGVIGGYITAKQNIIDAIKSVASGFIFTTAIPPAIAAAILENIKYVKNNPQLRQIHQEKVTYLKILLKENNINIIENNSHIVCVMINDAKKAEEISKKLLNDFNIYIQHINYPTVAKGQERLRIIVTPLHSQEMIQDLVRALTTII